MSFFQDVRSRYAFRVNENTPARPNPYYQKFVSEKDGEFLDGYDWVADNLIENCFANLDIYTEDLEDFGLTNEQEAQLRILFAKMDLNALAIPADEAEDKKIAQSASIETVLAMWFRNCLLHYMEMNRNELVTSMIEGMDENEYREKYKEEWGKYPEDEDKESNSGK